MKLRPTTGSTHSNLVLTVALFIGGCAVILMVDRGTIFLITEILIWALFAVSVNLLLTYARLISFGQAAYFGLGAYGFALSIWWLDLPMVAGLFAGPALATVMAFAFGALCVRLTRIYFAMLTLACAQVVFAVIFKWYKVTGGDTGLTGFAPSRLGLSAEWFGILVLAVVSAGIYAMWRTVQAPIGLAIRSVGDNALRATTLGYSRKFVQLLAFTMSGFWAGVAGTLFAAMHGAVFVDYADVEVTLDGADHGDPRRSRQLRRTDLRRRGLQACRHTGEPVHRDVGAGDRRGSAAGDFPVAVGPQRAGPPRDGEASMSPEAGDLLALDGVTKTFKRFVALNDVSLSVPDRQRRAIIGPNGAGKSTLINIVSGQLRPDHGKIRFDGIDLLRVPPFRRPRLRIGRTFQISNTFTQLTVLENVLSALNAASAGALGFQRRQAQGARRSRGRAAERGRARPREGADGRQSFARRPQAA